MGKNFFSPCSSTAKSHSAPQLQSLLKFVFCCQTQNLVLFTFWVRHIGTKNTLFSTSCCSSFVIRHDKKRRLSPVLVCACKHQASQNQLSENSQWLELEWRFPWCWLSLTDTAVSVSTSLACTEMYQQQISLDPPSRFCTVRNDTDAHRAERLYQYRDIYRYFVSR